MLVRGVVAVDELQLADAQLDLPSVGEVRELDVESLVAPSSVFLLVTADPESLH